MEPYIYEVLKKFKLEGLSVAHQPAPTSRLEPNSFENPFMVVADFDACTTSASCDDLQMPRILRLAGHRT